MLSKVLHLQKYKIKIFPWVSWKKLFFCVISWAHLWKYFPHCQHFHYCHHISPECHSFHPLPVHLKLPWDFIVVTSRSWLRLNTGTVSQWCCSFGIRLLIDNENISHLYFYKLFATVLPSIKCFCYSFIILQSNTTSAMNNGLNQGYHNCSEKFFLS